MQFSFSSKLTQGHLAIWASEIRVLQTSFQLKVLLRGCLTDLCLFPASKEVLLNTELLLKQCRAEVSWNVWWRWAQLWAVLLSTLWGDAPTAYGKSDKSIWVLAQLELDASEGMATWNAEAMLSFCVWIWWTYQPKVTVLKSKQPGSAGVCWQGSSTTAIYLQPECLLGTAGERNQTVHLGECCFGEAACTLTSSTMTCATNIFVSAVQQWELGQQRISYDCLPRPSPCWDQIPRWQQTPLGGAEVGMSSYQFPAKGNTWLDDHQRKLLLPAEMNEQPGFISTCS